MTHRGSEAGNWIKGNTNLQLCNFNDGATCGEMGQEEVDTQFFACRDPSWAIDSQSRARKSMSWDLCLGPAPGLGLPKLKGTTAEQSTSKETLLYFFLHITFLSAINRQKILFSAQKSKGLFLQFLQAELFNQLSLLFISLALSHASPLQSEDTSGWELQGLSHMTRGNSGLLGILGILCFYLLAAKETSRKDRLASPLKTLSS